MRRKIKQSILAGILLIPFLTTGVLAAETNLLRLTSVFNQCDSRSNGDRCDSSTSNSYLVSMLDEVAENPDRYVVGLATTTFYTPLDMTVIGGENAKELPEGQIVTMSIDGKSREVYKYEQNGVINYRPKITGFTEYEGKFANYASYSTFRAYIAKKGEKIDFAFKTGSLSRAYEIQKVIKARLGLSDGDIKFDPHARNTSLETMYALSGSVTYSEKNLSNLLAIELVAMPHCGSIQADTSPYATANGGVPASGSIAATKNVFKHKDNEPVLVKGLGRGSIRDTGGSEFNADLNSDTQVRFDIAVEYCDLAYAIGRRAGIPFIAPKESFREGVDPFVDRLEQAAKSDEGIKTYLDSDDTETRRKVLDYLFYDPRTSGFPTKYVYNPPSGGLVGGGGGGGNSGGVEIPSAELGEYVKNGSNFSEVESLEFGNGAIIGAVWTANIFRSIFKGVQYTMNAVSIVSVATAFYLQFLWIGVWLSKYIGHDLLRWITFKRTRLSAFDPDIIRKMITITLAVLFMLGFVLTGYLNALISWVLQELLEIYLYMKGFNAE